MNSEKQNKPANAVAGLAERLAFNEDFKLDWHDKDEAHDGYQLKWVGKNYARLEVETAPDTMIIPDEKHNAQAGNTDSKNIFLTGDNLQVLKHLQNCYRGAVKMIYIDPPYNTGSDDFVYQDKFEFSDEKLRDMLGLTEEEVKRLHIINSRSSHSAWLSFMYPRLKLARNLLSDDGVIFISIDDNEQANLKLLCDEVFGEGNFIEIFSWVKTSTPPSLSKKSRKTNEYILCYEKLRNDISYNAGDVEGGDQPLLNAGNSTRNLIFPVGSIVFNKGSFPDGEYAPTRADRVENKETFSIKDGINSLPVTLRGEFKWTQEFLDTELAKGTRFVIKSKNFAIRFIRDEIRRKRPNNHIKDRYITPIINKETGRVGTNESAAKEVAELLWKSCFNYPKPVSLIKYISKFTTAGGDIIFDFFAGSGTTAHAVMELNKEDGGKRQWILCQLDEQTAENSEARKAGFETIDQIARERIKRAAEKLGDTSGFKHFYVKQPEAQTIDKITEFDPQNPRLIADDMVAEFACPVLDTKGEEVILATWAAADSYKLTDKIEELDIAGYTAHYAGNSKLYLIAQGWGAEQTKELLNRVGKHKLNLNMLIVYGYSFTLESLRELEINIKQSLDITVQIKKRY